MPLSGITACEGLSDLHLANPQLYGQARWKDFFASPNIRRQLQSLTLQRFYAEGLFMVSQAPSSADYGASFASMGCLRSCSKCTTWTTCCRT